MNEILFLPDLITAIKVAVFAKYKVDIPDIKKQSNSTIRKELDRYLSSRYNIEVKTETLQKIKTKVAAERAPAKVFIVMATYLLDGDKTINFNGYETVVSLAKKLRSKALLDPTILDLQLKEWGALSHDFIYYYAFYYSLGGKKPDVALLRIDEKWANAELLFYRNDTSSFSGSVVHEGNGATVFITLTDKKTKYMAFLSMKQQRMQPIGEVKRFDGYYCSALTDLDGNPVAGKMIAVQDTEAEVKRLAENMDIAYNYSAELLNERLEYKNHSLSTSDIAPFLGVHQGYWFMVKDAIQQIVCISFTVHPDGTVSFIEDGIEDQTGYIHQITNTVLRCSFGYIDEHNYRMTIIFDIKDKKALYFDGLYSGQRIHGNKIMGGKIRIYPQKGSETVPFVGVVNFAEAETVLPERGKDLLNYFWGRDNGTRNNFIYPSYQMSKDHFSKQNADNILKQQNLKFSGQFLMYRLDGVKNRINCYHLKIESSGQFTYSMTSDGRSCTYSGTAEIIDSISLVLSVNKKGDESYSAIYIFFLGKGASTEPLVSGVYATIAFDHAPVCGRVILSSDINKDQKITKPFVIGSEEYRKAEDSVYSILKFLTGTENNKIKSPHKRGNLDRNIIYSEVFYTYASHYLVVDNKLPYLKLAFDHGFDELSRLRADLKDGAFSHLKNKILIHDKGKGECEIEFKIGQPSIRYYVRDTTLLSES